MLPLTLVLGSVLVMYHSPGRSERVTYVLWTMHHLSLGGVWRYDLPVVLHHSPWFWVCTGRVSLRKVVISSSSTHLGFEYVPLTLVLGMYW